MGYTHSSSNYALSGHSSESRSNADLASYYRTGFKPWPTAYPIPPSPERATYYRTGFMPWPTTYPMPPSPERATYYRTGSIPWPTTYPMPPSPVRATYHRTGFIPWPTTYPCHPALKGRHTTGKCLYPGPQRIHSTQP